MIASPTVQGSFNSLLTNLRCLIDGGVSVRAGFIEMDENRGHYDRTGEMAELLRPLEIYALVVTKCVTLAAVQSVNRELSDLCGACAGHTACVSHEGDVLPCVMARN